MYLVVVMHVSILIVHVPIFKWFSSFVAFNFLVCIQNYLRDLIGLVLEGFFLFREWKLSFPF